MDVGQHTASGDGDVTQEAVELLIIAHGQLDVAGDDAGLLVVLGGIAGQLEDLGSEVLEDGADVDGGASAHARRDACLADEACKTADRELQTGLGASADGLALGCRLLSTTCSCCEGRGEGGGDGRREWECESAKSLVDVDVYLPDHVFERLKHQTRFNQYW